MTVVSLPLQFQNSFWSQDYRKGLEVLYSKLEQVRQAYSENPLRGSNRLVQGVAENDEIVAFIRVRILPKNAAYISAAELCW